MCCAYRRRSLQNSHSRLRLPLQVAEAVCECGADLDREGRHRAACARSGRLKTRALAPERTLARVCREAGATVRFNAKLRDMNLLFVAADDERAIEVLASGPSLRLMSHSVAPSQPRGVHSQGQPPSTEPCAEGLEKTRNASTQNFSVTTGVVWSWLPWRQEDGGAKRPRSSWRA